ncbi:hypothetical protein, partial [Mycolicibacterium insubricum]|uniref:hypothetical protein n=1 Tax=Mycolicibacterium insubricum TaxID=444597 RepID=UPI0021F3008B
MNNAPIHSAYRRLRTSRPRGSAIARSVNAPRRRPGWRRPRRAERQPGDLFGSFTADLELVGEQRRRPGDVDAQALRRVAVGDD